jgi:GNAT superfamily N-acetyltransferase
VTGSAIREATEGDWVQIWPFFSAIVEAGETYAYPTGLDWEAGRALWYEPPPGQTVVLEDLDEPDHRKRILGSAKMGPNRPGGGDHIGTASFMVSPEAQGRGVGRQLAEYVVAWHREQGFRGIQFNAVVETNTGAVALWRSLGFEVVGTVPGAFRHPTLGYVGLHVMFLPLP